MSETPEPGRPSPAFPEAIRKFREDIGAVGTIPQTLPRPSRTFPRLILKHGSRGKLVIVLCVLILVMAVAYVAPRLAGPDAVPAELVGVWTTNDPRYQGRYLELTPDALTLRPNAKEGMVYGVRRVQRRGIPQGSAYVITTYSERAGDYILMLDYDDAQRTIALGKPARGLWRRAR